jgi:hypothetical protein
MWQPVNYDAEPTASATADAVAAGTTIPKGAELDSWSQETFCLSRSAAMTLGFSIASIDAKGEQRVFVAEASRYKEVPAADGKTRLRYGVALRLVVHAVDFEGHASLSLPVLAAKVSFGQAQASTSLLLRGYVGHQIALPEFSVLTVENYGQWIKSVSDMETIFNADVDGISPVLLAKLPLEPDEDTIALAVGEVWALAEIAQGTPLADAIARFPGGAADGDAARAMQETYAMIVGGGGGDVPDNGHRAEARRRLGGLHIRT